MGEELNKNINGIATLKVVTGNPESLAGRTYFLGLGLLLPLLGFSILYLWQSDLAGLVPLPILALLTLSFGARRRISETTKIWILSSILFGCALVDLILLGWTSDARILFIGSILLTALFISKNAGFVFWVGGGLITAVHIFLSYDGWLNLLQQTSNKNVFLIRMIGEWLVFVAFGFGVITLIRYWYLTFQTFLSTTQKNTEATVHEHNILAEREEALQQREDSLHKRISILDATASIAVSLTDLKPVGSLLTSIVELVSHHFGFEQAFIYMVDDSGNSAVLKAASSAAGKKLIAQDFQLSIDETSIIGWVVLNKQLKTAELIENVYPTISGSMTLKAECTLPLLVADELVGVFDLQSSDALAFDDNMILALQRLSSEIALAISISQRLDEIPDMDIIRPFYQAGLHLTSARTEMEVYAAMLNSLGMYQPSRLLFLRQFEELFMECESKNGTASINRKLLASSDLAYLREFAQYGIQTQESMWLVKGDFDADKLPDNLSQIMTNSDELMSLAIVPVSTGNQKTGIIISIYDHLHTFSNTEMCLYKLVALLTGVAIERIALMDDVVSKAEQDRNLAVVRNRLRSSLDPDVILRTTVRELGQLLAAEVTEVTIEVAGSGVSANG